MNSQSWHELWVLFLVVLALVGFFTGQALVVGFAGMALLTSGIAWAWNRVALVDLSYRRELSESRVFAGEPVTMTLTLTNRKPVPLPRVFLEDEVPDELRIEDGDAQAGAGQNMQSLRHATSLSWYERVTWTYTVRCAEPGFFRLGSTKIESGDLFGFFSSSMTEPGAEYLLVYPKVVPLSELGIPSERPLGEVMSGSRIFEDPARPSGIREYQQGDPLKIVDWMATARLQSLHVRSFEPTSTTTVMLVVAVETMSRRWEGYSRVYLNRVVTAAASVASYSAERGYVLGLFSNGSPILADRPMKVPPSRSPEQLNIVLEALATIRPFEVGPMAAQLGEHSRRFPSGATLVIVVAFMHPELEGTIGDLKGMGHKIVVIYVGGPPCPTLPNGVIVHEVGDYFDRLGVGSEYAAA